MRVDPSGWTTRLDEEMIARFQGGGSWVDATIGSRLDRFCDLNPDALFLIDGACSLTNREAQDQALRLAAGLRRIGVRRGNVVSFQLPNWHEAVIVELACAYAGFVCNPIVTVYRDAEVAFIVRDPRARVLFVPEQFRGFDHLAMADRLREGWPEMIAVVPVRPSLPRRPAYADLVSAPLDGDIDRPDPNDVKLIMYTSGTTGPPKGVLHTHNTIDTEIRNIIAHLGLDSSDRVLMPSALGHITGYLYGIQLPVTLGCPVVLMDQWDARTAADLIEAHALTFTIGATPFLQELARFARAEGRSLPSLRYFPTGGAPVPPEVIRDATAAFARCWSFRIYGSTEAPTVSLGVPDRTRPDLASATEGYIVGHEVRLVDDAGRPVAQGQEGEIITRGPEMCVGYASLEQNAEAFDGEGFFHTGDLAYLTSEGCLVISGRKKDLIIRGGENLSPKEIEDVLHAHPAVEKAAVVAMPHPRLGETGCAFVVPRGGCTFTWLGMEQALAASGLAKQKFPERLEIVSELPHTAAGKVQKNLLRERIAQILDGESRADVSSSR
jgi:acyl-CoA synthetase (AMP-forming)/AMP-acid ligase II